MRLVLLCALLLVLFVSLGGSDRSGSADKDKPATASQEGYLFCFWNTENLFDDQNDGLKNEADRPYDSWFSRDDKARKQKYGNLARVLAGMNGGKGPDILALAEVESERSVELLRDALNERLKDPELRLKHILYKDPAGGRNIATAILTRLPVIADRTRLSSNKRLRILEGHVKINNHDLVILATHWTSRVSDEGAGRAKYGDLIYGIFHRMYRANPNVDLLVCGDFNDNPTDDSVVKHLHAVGEIDRVKAGGEEPLLLNLFTKMYEENEAAGKKVGSHFYRGKAYIFDQIAVSPGLLDPTGWWCDPKSAQIYVAEGMADRKGAPIRFGNEKDRVPLEERGASDHFPVTVRLTVSRR
jgi:endonuclease/exonuclease/phosphatase family metal-dependent hydrolase